VTCSGVVGERRDTRTQCTQCTQCVYVPELRSHRRNAIASPINVVAPRRQRNLQLASSTTTVTANATYSPARLDGITTSVCVLASGEAIHPAALVNYFDLELGGEIHTTAGVHGASDGAACPDERPRRLPGQLGQNGMVCGISITVKAQHTARTVATPTQNAFRRFCSHIGAAHGRARVHA
jgi:hypothetical protein